MERTAVLIVEDDPAVANTLTHMLPRELMRRRATTASTAIRMLRAHADWALFLIDVGLGEGGSGLDVLDVAIAEPLWPLTSPTSLTSGWPGYSDCSGSSWCHRSSPADPCAGRSPLRSRAGGCF